MKILNQSHTAYKLHLKRNIAKLEEKLFEKLTNEKNIIIHLKIIRLLLVYALVIIPNLTIL